MEDPISYGEIEHIGRELSETLLSRVRRSDPSSDLVEEWWIDENMTKLYTHDPEITAKLFHFTALVNYIFLFLYIFVAIVGILANGLVLLRMCMNHKLRTPSNFFITNLAASDLLVLGVLCATRVLITVLPQYYGNPTLVNTILYIQHVCIQATALILATMSFTRYHFIAHPLEAKVEWTSRRVCILCGIIWIVSFVLYIPIWFGVVYVEGNTIAKLVPIPIKRQLFAVTRLIPMFILPGMIILMSYCRIVTLFKSRGNFIQGSSMDANESFKKQTDQQARKLTRTVVIIILVFFLSWGPYQFYLSGLDLRPYFLQRTPQKWKAVVVSSASLRLLAYLGCAINPFIYAYSNPAFLKIKRLKSLFTAVSSATKSTTVDAPGPSSTAKQIGRVQKDTAI